ncbi:hypothetical protein JB92DRAFT_2881511 [Gautieria morchelliformis]|nr:hypothetical protein JB92DRAFT_2881511 [Gautieria morchelliformis]
MSDRDAAEALDALGKAGRRSAQIRQQASQEGVFELEQGHEPQRKRPRRTRGSGAAASDHEPSVSPGQRANGDPRPTEDVQRDREEYERNTLTPVATHTWDIHQHPHAHPGGSPHGHGGFDLPPLAELDVLSNAHPNAHHQLGGTNRSFNYSGPGARARSPHDAHQSTHQNTSAISPTAATQGSLHLPPLSHAHTYPFLPSHLSPARPRGAETHTPTGFVPQQQPHAHQQPSHAAMFAEQEQQEQQHQRPAPSYADLVAHYSELHEERKRIEGLLNKTDEIMRGVKRGLDEMRAAGAPGSAAPQESLRLPPRERREREVVWRVEETEASQ